MSESPRKLRSPLAAYGPVIGLSAVAIISVIVLFSMTTTSPEAEATPVPGATPVSDEEMRERLGMPEPDQIRKQVDGLVKKYGYSWYDLPDSEKLPLVRLTRGRGQEMFESIVNEIREADLKKKKKP